MSNSESDVAVVRAKEPRRFFEKQLAGEQPLSFETAGQLYRLSMKLLAVQPWEFLEDQDLILMQDGESGEICYCSTMGALGEVFSFQVILARRAIVSFDELLRENLSQRRFFGSMRGVSVEFVNAREQTPPDRELLEAFGYLKKRGKRVPIIRALRPGYHPWYVTEAKRNSCLLFCKAYMRFAGMHWKWRTSTTGKRRMSFLSLSQRLKTKRASTSKFVL